MILDIFIRVTGVERCRAISIRDPDIREPPFEEELPFLERAQKTIPLIVLQRCSRGLVDQR